MAPAMPPRIDAHHHLWDLGVRDQPWINGAPMARIRRDFTVQDLEPAATAAGIDRTVVVQTVTEANETFELLAMAAHSPLVAGVVGWVDLTSPHVAHHLEKLRNSEGGDRLVGIRHQVQSESDPNWLSRQDVRRGLQAVAAAGLPYDLLTLAHQLPAATRTAAEMPQVTFVLNHASKPPIANGELEPWASRLRKLAHHHNVYCKLSGLITEARWEHWTVDDLRPYADTMFDAFGPRRVLFGSDWPVCLLAGTYAEVVSAAEQLTDQLTTAERQAVFGATAEAVYHLNKPAHAPGSTSTPGGG